MTTVESMKGDKSNSIDIDRLEQIVEKVTEVLDRQEDVKEELKAVVAAGKAVGFDMATVKKVIALRDEEKRIKFSKELDTLRQYSDLLGDGDPTNAV